MNNNQKGFTLIELMVVVVIIGILAAIALPNFLSMQDRAKEAEVKSNVHTLQLVIEDFKTSFNGAKPLNFNTFAPGAQPVPPNPGTTVSGTAIIMQPLKNPFLGIRGSNVISLEGLPAPLPANVTNNGIVASGLPQGNVGYTGELSNISGNPYCITGAGKLKGATINYVAVTLEGQ